MSLQYIIDGYNIINHPTFAERRNRRINDSRTALLELIKIETLCGSPRNKITVVFDGYPGMPGSRHSQDNINVIFSRNETADERIKKIIEASSHPKNMVVVSDDKEIRLFIRAVGCRSMGIEEFINRKVKLKVFSKEKELLKPELTFAQMSKINQELKKIWLK